MENSKADACTCTPTAPAVYESTISTRRDAAAAGLSQYETVMRDSHAFFKRRDLASYDEVPLYFAWERLYKAANKTLRVDWLDESYGEFLQRKHARVSPRRGLPPSVSAPLDRRSSGQAASTSGRTRDDPRGHMRSTRITKQAIAKEKRTKIKKMSKRTRAILEKIERELRSGEFTLKSPLKPTKHKRVVTGADDLFVTKPGLASVHPLSSVRQGRRGSLNDSELSFASSANPAQVAAFLASSLAHDDPLLAFDQLSPIKSKSDIRSGERGESKAGDGRLNKTIDTTQDSSFSDDGIHPFRPPRKLAGRPARSADRHQGKKTSLPQGCSHHGALNTLDESADDIDEDNDPNDDISNPNLQLRRTSRNHTGSKSGQPQRHQRSSSTTARTSRNNKFDERRRRISEELAQLEEPLVSRHFGRELLSQHVHSLHDESSPRVSKVNRNIDHDENGIGHLIEQESQQRMGASRNPSMVGGSGRNEYADEYANEDEGNVDVEQDGVGAESRSSDRRLSRSVGPQSRQSMTVAPPSQQSQQQQSQQRMGASRNPSMVGGSGRNEYADEYANEDEGNVDVEQDGVGAESRSSDRRLSRSVGPQSRQSMTVAPPSQQSQQQQSQQRMGASRNPSMVGGSGRNEYADEYANEDEGNVDVEQDGVGAESRSSDRRLSRSVGPQSRQSMTVAPPSQQSQQQQSQQRMGASRNPSMVGGSGRNEYADEYANEDEGNVDVEQDGVGAESRSSDRRLSRSVGPQSRQSMTVAPPSQQSQQQQSQQRMGASRNPSMVGGSGRNEYADEYANEDEGNVDVEQDGVGAESRSSDRRLSRSVGPQSRQSMTVAPPSQQSQQQQSQQRMGASRNPSMVGGSGRNEYADEYANEDEGNVDVEQDGVGAESRSSDRRLSRSVGPQSRQSMTVAPPSQQSQQQQSQQRMGASRNPSMVGGSGRNEYADEYANEDEGNVDVEQDGVGAESRSSDRRLSRSVGPQSRQSMTVAPPSQQSQQQQSQQRMGASRNPSMVGGSGRNEYADEYANEDEGNVDVEQDGVGAESRSSDRRLSRSVGPQSRQSMTVAPPSQQSQQQQSQQRMGASRNPSMVGGSGRNEYADEYANEDEGNVDVEQDGVGAESRSSDRRLSRSVGPQSRQSMTVAPPSQQSQQQQSQQRMGASRNPSMVGGSGRNEYADEYANEDEGNVDVEQDGVGAESRSSDRRLSRSVGPQSRQSMTVAPPSQQSQQQQSQQRMGASRNPSMVGGSGRNEYADEYANEDEGNVDVEQDGVGAESRSSDRRLSRSVGPQSRQSMTVAPPSQQSQQQQSQQRMGASRNPSMVGGSGRNEYADEYANEDEGNVDVEQDGVGAESRSSDRRLSRSVGPQSRQSMTVAPPSQQSQQQQSQQRMGASRNPSMVGGSGRNEYADEYANEDEGNVDVEQDGVGAESRSSDRRLSRSVGPQSRQSMTVAPPSQQSQQQQSQQRMGASRNPSMVGGSGRNEYADEYANEDEGNVDVEQDGVGAESRSSDRRLSRSVGPQSRQSMTVAPPSQQSQQQQSQQRMGASRNPSMVGGSGRNEYADEYANEDEGNVDVEQDGVGAESRSSDRRLSRSVGPQSRQSMSVPTRDGSNTMFDEEERLRVRSTAGGTQYVKSGSGTGQALKKLFGWYSLENRAELEDASGGQMGDIARFTDHVSTSADRGLKTGPERKLTGRPADLMMKRDSVDASRAPSRSVPQLSKLLDVVDEEVNDGDETDRPRHVSRKVMGPAGDPHQFVDEDERTRYERDGRDYATLDNHQAYPRLCQHQHVPSALESVSANGQGVRKLFRDNRCDMTTEEFAAMDGERHEGTGQFHDSFQDNDPPLCSEFKPKRKLSGRPSSLAASRETPTPMRGIDHLDREILSSLDEADEDGDVDGDGDEDVVGFIPSREKRQQDNLLTEPQYVKRSSQRMSLSRSHGQSSRRGSVRDGAYRERETHEENDDDDDTASPSETHYFALSSRVVSRQSQVTDKPLEPHEKEVARKQSSCERRNDDTLGGEHGGEARDVSRSQRPSRPKDESRTQQPHSHRTSMTDVLKHAERVKVDQCDSAEDVGHETRTRQRPSAHRASRIAVQNMQDPAALFAEGISSFGREQHDSDADSSDHQQKNRRTSSERRSSRRVFSEESARKDDSTALETERRRSSHAAVRQQEGYRGYGDYDRSIVEEESSADDRPKRKLTGRPGELTSTRQNGSTSRMMNGVKRSDRLETDGSRQCERDAIPERQQESHQLSREAAQRSQPLMAQQPQLQHFSERDRGATDVMATLFQEGVASYVEEANSKLRSTRSSRASGSDKRHGRRAADMSEGLDDDLSSDVEDQDVVEARSRRTRRSESHVKPDRLHGRHERPHEHMIVASTRNSVKDEEHTGHRDDDDHEEELMEQFLGEREPRAAARESRRSRKLSRDKDDRGRLQRREYSSRLLETVESSMRSKPRGSNQAEAVIKDHAKRDRASHQQIRLPPAPHPTMTGVTGRDYQKFQSAKATNGDVVWPPGMEDEAKRVPMYHARDTHHPLAPPGMNHLVSDDQLVEYWTWLHWYSCWQLYYLSLQEKKNQRASTKSTTAAKRGKSAASTRRVSTNWYVSLSDTNV